MKIEEIKKMIERWQGEIGKSSLVDLRGMAYDVAVAIEDLLSWDKPYYIRATNRRSEYTDIKNGVEIISTNHADNTPELGMSVADGYHYAAKGYKYYYKCTGTIISRGSDGEVILKNVKIIGKLQLAKNLKDNETFKKIEKLAKNLNIPRDAVIYLSTRKDDAYTGYLATMRLSDMAYAK